MKTVKSIFVSTLIVKHSSTGDPNNIFFLLLHNGVGVRGVGVPVVGLYGMCMHDMGVHSVQILTVR